MRRGCTGRDQQGRVRHHLSWGPASPCLVLQSASFRAEPRSQASWDGGHVNLCIKQRESMYMLYINTFWRGTLPRLTYPQVSYSSCCCYNCKRLKYGSSHPGICVLNTFRVSRNKHSPTQTGHTPRYPCVMWLHSPLALLVNHPLKACAPSSHPVQRGDGSLAPRDKPGELISSVWLWRSWLWSL